MATLWRGGAPLLLASTSRVRRDLLAAARLPVEMVPSGLDERAFEARLGPGIAPRDLALRLAGAKAEAVASGRPDRVVVGADQVLELDGRPVAKAADRREAAAHLARMSGRPHLLHAAAFLRVPGRDPAGFAETARLTMRDLGVSAIDAYLDAAGEAATRSAGGYEIEGLGIHLFETIDGDHTTILGIPMLPLLDALRKAGLLSL